MYGWKIPFYFLNVFSHLMVNFIFCIRPFKQDFRFGKKTTLFLTIFVIIMFCVSDITILEDSAPLSSFKKFMPIFTFSFIFAYCALIIKRHHFQLIFIIIIYLTLHAWFTALTQTIIHYFPLKPLFSWFPEINDLICQQLILGIFLYPMWYLSAKLFSRVKENGIDFLEWKFTIVLPIVLFLLAYLYIFHFMNEGDEPFIHIIFILLLMLTAFTSAFSILKVMITNNEKQAATEKAIMAQKQIEIARASIMQLSENIARSARERHDFRHHYLVIQDFIRRGDMAKAQEYLTKYDATHTLDTNIAICENNMLNAILTYYLSTAKESGAKVDAQVFVPNKLGIDDIELCICIGNLVENAVDAIKRQQSGEKHIALKTTIVTKQLVISVQNSFCGEILEKNGEFMSSKRVNKVGIGLDSVKKIVEKNGGDIKIHYDSGIFKVSVILNIE